MKSNEKQSKQYSPYWYGQELQSSPYQNFYFRHEDWVQGFQMMKHKKLKFLIQSGDRDGPVTNKAVEYPKTDLILQTPRFYRFSSGITGLKPSKSDNIR